MMPYFFISRLTASSSLSFRSYTSNHILLGSLLPHKHTTSLLFFNSFTSCTSSNYGNHHKGDTFSVSYLINSCGVSPTLAREVSNRVNLETSDGPNAVIDLLRNFGFSKFELAKLVVKQPSVLVANAKKTLLPKLKFFRSIGVSKTDMAKIIISSPTFLKCSLQNCLIPRYKILKSVVGVDRDVVRVMKNAQLGFIYGDLMNNLVPNINILRQCGVPQASISFMMINALSAAYVEQSRFAEAVKTVKEMGFNPLKTNFIVAIDVLLTMRKAMWDSRMEVYERWGWNREMALRAFRKFPSFMKLSEEKFTRKMSFLVKDMGWPSEAIAECPLVTAYNLEERIIPRFSVIKILKSKGLLEKHLSLSSIICPAEEKFLERFVIRFQNVLPLLPDVYRGVINHSNVM